jgi:hypothetical protein
MGHLEQQAGLDTCDGYVVVVTDPRVDEWDAFGPFSGIEATADAVRRRDELDREELVDVVVKVVRLHHRRSEVVAAGMAGGTSSRR